MFNKLDYLWNTKITITDTSSVKNHIKLKGVNNTVLSHPIAGSDKSGIDALDKTGGGLKEFLRLSGSNAEMWRDIFMLNRVDLIKALAGMQVSLNNLLELMTETKQIPDIFSHDEMLKNELKEIKSFKEDKF